MNGNKFDSSRDRNRPFEFVLGKGQVIKGWDVGVATMALGERARLIISPEYSCSLSSLSSSSFDLFLSWGYGKDGYPPIIPGNSVLIFDVELLAFK